MSTALAHYAPAYLTPGIYRRAEPPPAGRIEGVRTDVAGFVGYAERGPLRPLDRGAAVNTRDLVVRVNSWPEFVATFGGFIRFGCLAYAVRGFFENGGTTCYVVRVAAARSAGAPDWQQEYRPAMLALPSARPLDSVASVPQAARRNATVLAVSHAELLEAGNLLVIEKDGLKEFVMLEAIDEAKKTVYLAQRLRHDYAAGAGIRPFPSALLLEARTSGNWGNRIRVELKPLQGGKTVSEFSLRLTVDPGPDSQLSGEEEFYQRLSLNEESDHYAPTIINGRSHLVRTQEKAAATELWVEPDPLNPIPMKLQGGRDGISKVAASDFTGGLADVRGLRALEEIDEISILCAPDAVFEPAPLKPELPEEPVDPCAAPQKERSPSPVTEDESARPPALDPITIYREMLSQCERQRDRVAILAAPDGLSISQVLDWRDGAQLYSPFAAMYYPWLRVPDPLEVSWLTRRLPPTGHVAGVYARIDNQFGVQRPPANAELRFVNDVVEEITSRQQEELNPKGINALRPFAGRGIRVWGARSLASSAEADWKFIHVRRLMCMIEESVEDSTQWSVFEPNDANLRSTLVHSLNVFLEGIWRRGGLKGTKPAEGFYVKCDETNNPQSVVDAGQLRCQIGVAVAAPMEFLVFELRRSATGTEVVEA